MKRELKTGRTLSMLVMIALSLSTVAQEEGTANFLGLNPSVTIESFYEKGELDVNIFPLVYQRSLSARVDFRETAILNLGVRNAGNEISHVGIETAFPVFFKAKENKSQPSKGFFAAPIVSLTRNLMEKHNNLGLWLEPGYHLLFDTGFALSFGLQIGTTYFHYDDLPHKWGTHFGAKVIFGKWF